MRISVKVNLGKGNGSYSMMSFDLFQLPAFKRAVNIVRCLLNGFFILRPAHLFDEMR